MALKILIVIAVLIAAVIGVVCALAAAKPATFQIRRSTEIAAPPAKVYGLISDFHQWPKWAPQDREDSTMQRSFSGPVSGIGAVSEWQSKGSAGVGRMTITDAVATSHLTVEVDWARPFKAHNVNEFVLEPDIDGTKVTWTMHGPNLFVMRVMATFINMDKMMGTHFELGLRDLKAAAEAR